MSRKKRYIKDLSSANIEQLQYGKKHGKSEAYRTRCHAILLSFQGYDCTQIAQISGVGIRAVYNWLNNWERLGISGLKTIPGQGRKAKLSLENDVHVQVVETATKNAAEKGTNLLNEVIEKINPKDGLSRWTLNRFLRKKSTVGKDYVESRKKSRQK